MATDTKVTHTPTPWRYRAVARPGAFDGGEIMTTTSIQHTDEFSGPLYVGAYYKAADGAFIVQAVNCHDDLVEALKGLVDLLNDDLDDEQCAAWDAAIGALAKAGVQ